MFSEPAENLNSCVMEDWLAAIRSLISEEVFYCNETVSIKKRYVASFLTCIALIDIPNGNDFDISNDMVLYAIIKPFLDFRCVIDH
jgi:hypothetical protein